MQSKGSLGRIVAGVIAVFLVLICLFYLSFTVVSNSYDKKAEEYARVSGGGRDKPQAEGWCPRQMGGCGAGGRRCATVAV